MRRFSVIAPECTRSHVLLLRRKHSPARKTSLASLAFIVLSICSGHANAQVRTETTSATGVKTTTQTTNASAAKRIVLLLPTEQPLLRRAAQTVRDGVRAVAAKAGTAIELIDCAYGGATVGASAGAAPTAANDAVVQAYVRCVKDGIDAVIGPLGRNDVAALVNAKLPFTQPTLLLSPIGATPPENFYVLAPDLESEADAIARQSLDDACRKPILIGAPGATATRIAVAIIAHYRSGGVATPLAQHELSSRDRWQRIADGWRRDGVDCAFFTGGGAALYELRPFLRAITVYVTSASYEVELDRLVDWTGVRIADSPFVLDPTRSDFAAFAPVEALSPTLARLYALGIDAARIVFQAALSGEAEASALTVATLRDRRETLAETKPRSSYRFTESLNGAIGQLRLRAGQYIRTPTIGEFSGRIPNALTQ
jgi:uncharacterized protein